MKQKNKEETDLQQKEEDGDDDEENEEEGEEEENVRKNGTLDEQTLVKNSCCM